LAFLWSDPIILATTAVLQTCTFWCGAVFKERCKNN